MPLGQEYSQRLGKHLEDQAWELKSISGSCTGWTYMGFLVVGVLWPFLRPIDIYIYIDI